VPWVSGLVVAFWVTYCIPRGSGPMKVHLWVRLRGGAVDCLSEFMSARRAVKSACVQRLTDNSFILTRLLKLAMCLVVV